MLNVDGLLPTISSTNTELSTGPQPLGAKGCGHNNASGIGVLISFNHQPVTFGYHESLDPLSGEA
jgi:hypothetical protein